MRWQFLLIALLLGTAVHCQDDGDDEGDIDDVDFEEGSEEPTPNFSSEKSKYETPKLKGSAYFTAVFDSNDEFTSRWVTSQAKKDSADADLAKYDGKWAIEEPLDSGLLGDQGLVLKSRARHHAISSKLSKPFHFKGKPFVAQYEVKFQNGMECGGAYIKLLTDSKDLDLKQFQDKTPYTIMFGPDKCGQDAKLHFIFRHKNPITGEFEEKHAKKPSQSLDNYFTDKKSHLFTLVVEPNNEFQVYVDQELVNSGNLLEDMDPAVNPPEEIDDPDDKKPEDWDEREKIEDATATKPDDWDEDAPLQIEDNSAEKPDGWLDDEEELIPDPDSVKPDDWDEDTDGEWEPSRIPNPKCADAPGCGEWKRPTIENPDYKGKWTPPMIENPAYQGIWKPRRISNPNYFKDDEPYKMSSIAAVGLELWSMTDQVMFDNFIITDSKDVADDWAEQSFILKQAGEGRSASSGSVIDSLRRAADGRPWMYALYVVVLLLPVVLLSIWCCPRSGPVKEEDIARAKKTDEEQEDDSAAAGAGGDDGAEASPKKGKGALEVPASSSQETATELSQDEAESSQGEGTEEDNVEEAKQESPKTTTRKRKPRKD